MKKILWVLRGVPSRRRKNPESLFKEIIMENFPNLGGK